MSNEKKTPAAKRDPNDPNNLAGHGITESTPRVGDEPSMIDAVGVHTGKGDPRLPPPPALSLEDQQRVANIEETYSRIRATDERTPRAGVPLPPGLEYDPARYPMGGYGGPMHGSAGDVGSNGVTITALQAGVPVHRRFSILEFEGVDVPVMARESVQGDRVDRKVEVMADVIAEVERRRSGPRSRVGSVELHDVDSFVDFVVAYRDPNRTRIFVDAKRFGGGGVGCRVTAVMDYHASSSGDVGAAAHWSATGYGAFRAHYELLPSRQLEVWVGAHGKGMSQDAFADFIEENERDIGPASAVGDAAGMASSAEVLMMSRNLTVNAKTTYRKQLNKTTGEYAMEAKDENDATTSTRIPKGFVVAIPVFTGAPERYPFEVHIRMRMVEQKPVFSVEIMNLADVIEHATTGLRLEIAKRTYTSQSWVNLGAPPKCTAPEGYRG